MRILGVKTIKCMQKIKSIAEMQKKNNVKRRSRLLTPSEILKNFLWRIVKEHEILNPLEISSIYFKS